MFLSRIYKLRENKLFANSLLLMCATGAMAGFGFIFWVVVARLFHSSVVGLATTALSVSSLIALLSLVGFDTVLIRFLHNSKRKNDHINSGLMIVGGAAIVLSLLFCLLIPALVPKLDFILKNPIYVVGFVIFTIFTAWNSLTNAIFIAYRRAKFILIINIIFSAVKMVLPFLFHSGGPMEIFTLVGAAQILNVGLSVGILMKYFSYRPSLVIHFDLLREIKTYGFAAYFASLFNLLPDSALPIIVLNELGASSAAYFYIAFTIANLLYNIGFSTAQSMFAESSHDISAIAGNLRKAAKIISALLLPATAVLIIFSTPVLSIFGANYAQGATTVLRILGLSSIFVAFYSILGAMYKINKNLRAMVIVNFTNAIVIITLAVLLAGSYGLAGIGWAWFIGNVAACVVGLYFIRRALKISMVNLRKI